MKKTLVAGGFVLMISGIALVFLTFCVSQYLQASVWWSPIVVGVLFSLTGILAIYLGETR